MKLLSDCPHSTILDIGCGNGEFTLKVAKKVAAETTVGIERVLPIAKMASSKGINVILGDASNIFPFNLFKCLVSIFLPNRIIWSSNV